MERNFGFIFLESTFFFHSVHIFIGPTKTSIQTLLILLGIYIRAFCQISRLYVQVELK